MTKPTADRASYTTEDGYERYFVTAVVNERLFQQLEDYRLELEISRSEAVRRILSDHLSRQLHPTP